MKKIDPTVLRETAYIAAFVSVFSVLMQAVFLLIGKWDYTVLLGNLLGALMAVLNFFVMGLAIQAALGKEEKEIRSRMRASQALRMVALFAVAALGVWLPCFHSLAVVIPLLFPRIALAFRPLFKNLDTKEGK